MTEKTVDCGDYVVVTNARQVKVTGRKADQIIYRKHTLYPGGLKETKYKDMMDEKPDQVRFVVLLTWFRHDTFSDYSQGCLGHVAKE